MGWYTPAELPRDEQGRIDDTVYEIAYTNPYSDPDDDEVEHTCDDQDECDCEPESVDPSLRAEDDWYFFRCNLCAFLPPSFSEVKRDSRDSWIGREEVILAENRLLCVTAHDSGYGWVAVTVRVRPALLPDPENYYRDGRGLEVIFAKRHLPNVARRVFNGLFDCYETWEIGGPRYLPRPAKGAS